MAGKRESKDQAESLRSESSKRNYNSESALGNEREVIYNSNQNIDVLNLPPRSKVHEKKQKNFKWKLSYPVIRLVIVLTLLVFALIFIFQNWGESLLFVSCKWLHQFLITPTNIYVMTCEY